MGKYDNVGQLMHLPLDHIAPVEELYDATFSEFTVNAAAEAILNTDGRNWMPIIVKEIGDYQYQVVSNHFVYTVAQAANLERVWCIVIPADNTLIQQAKILAREETPKINLSKASGNSILAALRYLASEPNTALKGVDVIVAANRIEEANRSKWSDLSPISQLKCGITKGKKLDALSKVFFVEPPPPPPPAPAAVSITKASHEEVLERLRYLSNCSIGGFEKLNPDQIADTIYAAPKNKWKSLTPITKLECGIDTAKLKVLKTVFKL